MPADRFPHTVSGGFVIHLLLSLSLAASPNADQALFDRLSGLVADAYDESHGGFVEKSGMPSAAAVELAFAHSEDGAEWQDRAIHTVDWTWALFDSVGGGFYDLPKHADPTQPSFSKRTDSNANRLENLVQAWQQHGSQTYEQHAAQVIDYFERVLLDGRGGFMPGQFGDRLLIPEANGLAIHAWFTWCAATGDVRRRDFGLRSIDRVWGASWDPQFGLLRAGDFDVVTGPPLLTDQVEMGRACLVASQVAGRKKDLEHAVALGNLLVERFQDPKKGGFYSKAVPDKNDVIKKAPIRFDDNARAARFLCELTTVTGDERYRDAARRAWQSFDDKFDKAGLYNADWALAVRESFAPTRTAPAAWKEPASATPKPRSKRFR
jgi:uncharacterized protein